MIKTSALSLCKKNNTHKKKQNKRKDGECGSFIYLIENIKQKGQGGDFVSGVRR